MKILFSALFLLTLAACTSKYEAPSAGGEAVAELAAVPKASTLSAARFIALSHKVTLQADAAQLPTHFAAIQAECLKLGCEILTTSQEMEGRNLSPSAKLSARIPPGAFDAFFKHAQARAKLVKHEASADDKTAEVIDVEARIKNLEALKARILELLANRTATLKDTLEAEKQLAETQTQLDSIQGRRRVLAKETGMVKVDILLVTKTLRGEGSWAAPIAEAASGAGSVLASSLGALLTFIVAALPWVIVGWLALIPVRSAWRRRKQTAAANKQN
jgi:hypothetical protein